MGASVSTSQSSSSSPMSFLGLTQNILDRRRKFLIELQLREPAAKILTEEFLAICHPENYDIRRVKCSELVRFLEKRVIHNKQLFGVQRSRIADVVRSLCGDPVASEFLVPYEVFALIVLLADVSTPHNLTGLSGVLRLALIFQLYDEERKGVLAPKQWDSLMSDLFWLIDDHPESIGNASTSALDLLEASRRGTVTFQQFYELCREQKIRGTSQLFRIRLGSGPVCGHNASFPLLPIPEEDTESSRLALQGGGRVSQPFSLGRLLMPFDNDVLEACQALHWIREHSESSDANPRLPSLSTMTPEEEKSFREWLAVSLDNRVSGGGPLSRRLKPLSGRELRSLLGQFREAVANQVWPGPAGSPLRSPPMKYVPMPPPPPQFLPSLPSRSPVASIPSETHNSLAAVNRGVPLQTVNRGLGGTPEHTTGEGGEGGVPGMLQVVDATGLFEDPRQSQSNREEGGQSNGTGVPPFTSTRILMQHHQGCPLNQQQQGRGKAEGGGNVGPGGGRGATLLQMHQQGGSPNTSTSPGPSSLSFGPRGGAPSAPPAFVSPLPHSTPPHASEGRSQQKTVVGGGGLSRGDSHEPARVVHRSRPEHPRGLAGGAPRVPVCEHPLPAEDLEDEGTHLVPFSSTVRPSPCTVLQPDMRGKVRASAKSTEASNEEVQEDDTDALEVRPHPKPQPQAGETQLKVQREETGNGGIKEKTQRPEFRPEPAAWPAGSGADGGGTRQEHEVSQWESDRNGFGLAWVFLQFNKTGRCHLPFESLDLSGPHVCKEASLPILLSSLRMKEGGTGQSPFFSSLKTLDLSNRDLDERAGAFFQQLPPSLEHLLLNGNRLRRVSVERLSPVFASGGLPNLLSLDLSGNPLGPSGLKALVTGLTSAPHSLPLQSLKLAHTKAKAEGVEALGEAVKAKKLTSLQTLDLEGNNIMSAGVHHLASAVKAGGLPHLRTFVLKNNFLTEPEVRSDQREFTPIAELLSTSALKELEELNLNENLLFDRELEAEGMDAQLSAASLLVPGRFPKLKRLDLGGSIRARLSSSQLVAFAAALGVKGSPCLQEVVLPANYAWQQNPAGSLALANAFSLGHLSHLTRLTISGALDMTSEIFASLCGSFATGKVSRLQSLDLEICDENPEGGVRALAESIRGGGLRSLTNFRLNVVGCLGKVEADGNSMSILGAALGSGGCPSLEKLDLDWIEEGDEGVRGLAEGLGGERLPCLRDLYLSLVSDYPWEGGGEGCVALGEVLSTNKVPSLRSVKLCWSMNESLVPLCEGLSRGRVGPPTKLEMKLMPAGEGCNVKAGVSGLAQVIRKGKLSGLYRLTLRPEDGVVSDAEWEAFGEAFTHAEASLESLQSLCLQNGSYMNHYDWFSAFLNGMSRGSGRLPALCSLSCPRRRANSKTGFEGLSALVRNGNIPSLGDLKVDLNGLGHERAQTFGSALSSPHISSLRRLDVSLADPFPPFAVDEVRVLSGGLNSGHLQGLKELCVRGLIVTDNVRALCVGLGSGKLTSLRKLNLNYSPLRPAGGRALSEVFVAEKLPSLQTFEASGAQLEDEGLRALIEGWMTRSPPPLRRLDLWGNRFTGAVAEDLLALLGSKRMPSLDSVILRPGQDFDEKWRRSLSEAFPDVVEFNASGADV
uniref:EF-hand domain-containing protein n=1 Tax=Chromera velia CCMP2878 TaxID=1169474 RepID=A0A0G4G1D9_9ALVE|eukprot:Cvel_19749.t1-p1 / transcript=Cvel_19749.t1 / gene=Cvel_19749 / organism=Chromera_velia_CCMP2878 / gene_product=hypothetical protein / transcript_product=hypothetical protein / location=Cvel_scaffold1729:1439-12553(-) / protein_length=1630 / sequence_SO=supercontig / SO=protein_coding / is_pseudo=false